MHPITQFVMSLSALTIASSLVTIVFELQKNPRPGELKRGGRLSIEKLGSSPSLGITAQQMQAGYAIYVFRDGAWHLEADLSAPGCETTPPLISGSFQGQVVKKESSFRK